VHFTKEFCDVDVTQEMKFDLERGLLPVNQSALAEISFPPAGDVLFMKNTKVNLHVSDRLFGWSWMDPVWVDA
jgi:hypothetical protein